MEVQTLSYGRINEPRPAPNEEIKSMQTYFSKPEIQYPPVTENGDIDMAGFLRACSGIVEFVGFLGTAFSPVKNDVNGNKLKVESTFQTDPQRYATVKKLIDAEISDWPTRMGPATEGLLYLKRALEFISVFLELIVNDHKFGTRSNSLVPLGRQAYERTLKKHHGTLERGLFKVVIYATPYRKDLLKTIAIGQAQVEDECIADIERYLEVMKANVGRLVEMYKEVGFEK